jgi:hypothetical protein
MAGGAVINCYNGGTAANQASQQVYVATSSAFINNALLGTGDVKVTAGVTCVVGAADPLYECAPQLFQPLQSVTAYGVGNAIPAFQGVGGQIT